MRRDKGRSGFLLAALLGWLSVTNLLFAEEDLVFLRRDIETRGFPQSIASGDFNADKIPDLVVTGHFIGGGTMILLGQADGTFTEAQRLEPGGDNSFVTVADLNGDGIPDLAVANNQANTVSILLGVGDGTFVEVQTVPVGSRPLSIAVADFNGDAVPDLAVANSNAGLAGRGSVSILLGVGDGRFGEARDVTMDSPEGTPRSIISGDFNNDGVPDLAIANYSPLSQSTVSILIGQGDGTFQRPRHLLIYGGALAITAQDFNGDQILDLAVVSRGNGSCDLYAASAVAILLG